MRVGGGCDPPWWQKEAPEGGFLSTPLPRGLGGRGKGGSGWNSGISVLKGVVVALEQGGGPFDGCRPMRQARDFLALIQLPRDPTVK